MNKVKNANLYSEKVEKLYMSTIYRIKLIFLDTIFLPEGEK